MLVHHLMPVLVIVATLSFLAPVQADDPAAGSVPKRGIPQEFTPVDTSRLMGSPDPLPLEAVPVFRHPNFERPIELTTAGDGSNRLFVAEQRGVIRVFENRKDVRRAETFLDISDVVSRVGNEEGLLGLAFHPDYSENGELYVYYSINPPASVVSRFRVSEENPSRVDRNSEVRLLKLAQPYRNHNGGSIRFGPDGFLYIGLGDGGLANDPHYNGQNLETLLGSILRIDVDHTDPGRKYAVPDDNPFVDREDAQDEIWAYGFRNPWRISFDRKTGQLWTGDVGQNRFEEIDLVRKGQNYGWNIREGRHEFDINTPEKPEHLVDPAAEYFRHMGESITGGLVYRGSPLKSFEGHYFYADYLSGNVWALPADQGQDAAPRLVARTDLEVTAFGEDADGEMYLCVFDGIYQLRPRDIDLKKTANEFPRRLSETGLFDSVSDHIPAAGLIPYEINVPFWSDYAVKDRYIALPRQGEVKFHSHKKWDFPVGTVFVKTFWIHQERTTLSKPKRLETRLLVHSPQGWQGYTYLYDDQYQDARLLNGSETRALSIQTEDGTITQPYYFPSRKECFACHTRQDEFVLGLTTRQMNRRLNYKDRQVDQLELLERLNVFSNEVAREQQLAQMPEWGFGNFDRSGAPSENTLEPPEGDVEQLARAWLEVNCAMCHQPNGIGPGRIDMRYSTPLPKTDMVRAQPRHGQMTPSNGRRIIPGKPYLSELLIRAGHRGVRQMPPIGSNLVSSRAMTVLEQWIREMPEN